MLQKVANCWATCIWATFIWKFVAKNFQKSSNLVTLLVSQLAEQLLITSRIPVFKSSHGQFLLNIYWLLLNVLKRPKGREKRLGNGPFRGHTNLVKNIKFVLKKNSKFWLHSQKRPPGASEDVPLRKHFWVLVAGKCSIVTSVTI